MTQRVTRRSYSSRLGDSGLSILRAFTLPPDDVVAPVKELLLRARAEPSVSAARSLAEAAWASAQAHDLITRAASAHSLCFHMFREGRLTETLKFGREQLPTLKHSGLIPQLHEMLRWTALSACEIGEFAAAIELAMESHRLAEETDDVRTRILAMNLLGGAFERAGDPWQAKRVLQVALEMARDYGESYTLVSTLNNLGAVLVGKFYSLRDSMPGREQSDRVLEELLPIFREVVALVPALNDPYALTMSRGNLGEVLVHVGAFDEAQSLLEESLQHAHERGFHAVGARVSCSLGELYVARGEHTRAIEHLSKLRSDQSIAAHVSTQIRCHHALYLAYRAAGRIEDALCELETCRRLEARRSADQLRAKSELMVTRFEADETKRRGLERAYELARQHAKRAAALQKLAMQDELTGLGNRRALDAKLARLMDSRRSDAVMLAAVVIDLDRFKSINDRFGHDIGDRALVEVAKILQNSFRPDDCVARTGGEEFIVLIENLAVHDVEKLCAGFRTNLLEHSWAKLSPDLFVTASVGIACAPPESAQNLLASADRAMYRAKEGGRNRSVSSV